MNEHIETLIRELAEIEFDKRQAYNSMSVQGMKTNYEEAKAQAIEYALVKAEWVIAKNDLDRAMNAKGPP